MVYDVSVYSSLKKAKQWITRIKERIKEHPVGFVLVGNKVILSFHKLISNTLANRYKTDILSILFNGAISNCTVTMLLLFTVDFNKSIVMYAYLLYHCYNFSA